MQKWIMFTLLLVAVALGGSVLAEQIVARQAMKASEAKAGPSLKIAASNYKFDQPEYTVKTGEKLTVQFSNKEGLHAIEISGYNVKLDGQNKSAEVTFDKPGTYEIICSLPCGTGHAEMKSKLVVQ